MNYAMFNLIKTVQHVHKEKPKIQQIIKINCLNIQR